MQSCHSTSTCEMLTIPDYIERLEAHIKSHPEQVNFRDLAIDGEQFGVPNFTSYSYAFNPRIYRKETRHG